MARFSQYNDTPFQINNIGNDISIKLIRTNSGIGTISWNIPSSPGDCTSDNKYNGILITIDVTPTATSKQPINGVEYDIDPTANATLHMGSKLGTSLVVGNTYGDVITNSIIVTGLDDDKTYYVTGFAVDNVKQYHTAGVHSYSQPYSVEKHNDTAAYQLIKVGDDNGVLQSTLTGLDVNKSYELPMILDHDLHVTLELFGSDVQTYGKLVDELNRQAMLIDNPFISAGIPNLGLMWYQSELQQLSQWNGTQYINKGVLIQPSAPDSPAVDDLWVTDSGTIKQWNGTSWIVKTGIYQNHAPNELQCNDYWFNGTDCYTWSGSSWIQTDYYITASDPYSLPVLSCSSFWFDETSDTLKEWDDCKLKWTTVLAQYSATDPLTPPQNHLWYNETTDILYKYVGLTYVAQVCKISTVAQTILSLPASTYSFNPDTMELFFNDGVTIVPQPFLLWMKDPLVPVKKSLWWNDNTDILQQWDDSTDSWAIVSSFVQSDIDPTLRANIPIGSVWTIDLTDWKRWDGSEWISQQVVQYPTNPTTIPNGSIWNNMGEYSLLVSGSWVPANTIKSNTNPIVVVAGDYWMQTPVNILHQHNGTMWLPIQYSIITAKPKVGFKYYDATLMKLRQWNGTGWIDGAQKFTASFHNLNRYIKLESSLLGSYSRVELGYDATTVIGLYKQSEAENFMAKMSPHPMVPMIPVKGGDGLQELPSYMQIGPGLGSDGSSDERREMIDSIRVQFGYPNVEVELTKTQMNTALDNALETFRSKSGSAYRRGFKFLRLEPGKQHYQLTDIKLGFNKIVSISKIHRISSSAFSQSSWGGWAGQGQLVLQQMYTAGSYDLISHHMVAQYMEVMEQMFATAISFNWNEDNRTLSIYEVAHKAEMVLLECAEERSEQVLLKDRFTKTWIQRMAKVECMLILLHTRGKYATLPGAGGGVSLNAADIASRADADEQALLQELEDFLSNNPEEWGSQIVMG